MARYIRSHSNYRLSTRHQETASGTILERDISTVGGVDSFATGQATIYSSGNFVMTVNNTSSSSRHVIRKGWLANSESGDTWNAEVLASCTSDVNGSVERSIGMKNDFLDLRSFACYGSLYSLVQSSVSGIIEKFPYEVYTGGEDAQPGQTGLYEASNPASVDMHSRDIQEKEESLRYFANGGYLSYSIHTGSPSEPSDGYPFTWSSVSYNTFSLFSSDSGTITLPQLDDSKVYGSNLYVISFTEEVSASRVRIGNTTYQIGEHAFNPGDVVYGRIVGSKFIITSSYCPEPGDYVATVTLGYDGGSLVMTAMRDASLEVKYYVGSDGLGIHIRPRESMGFYDDFLDSLDMFQKCLVGVYSGTRNVAKFEVLSDESGFDEKTLETFELPTGDGRYNIGADVPSMADYIQRLARIGLRYDERYTDNMYRVMTHESLKNFDWTRNFNGSDGEYENEYTETGEKFKSVVRIMGYVFDQEKTYIDCIGNTNTITYDNRSNLPDYFLTDSLETDGWDVRTIYPLELREVDEDGNEMPASGWNGTTQEENVYLRKFSENTTELIRPYSYYEGAFYPSCSGSTPVLVPVQEDGGQPYYNDGGVVKNVIRDYHDDVEVTIPDVNNEFMRRLRINSRHIFSRKGTVEGIESVLGLFGMRSKRWYDALVESDPSYANKYKANLTRKLPYDFEVKEYTLFTPPVRETWDKVDDMYQIDFYNSCKTIPYNTQSYINGVYIPYQGLPVAYRDVEGLYLTQFVNGDGVTVNGETKHMDNPNICTDSNGDYVHARRLYPGFESRGIYDGGMYYQMNGGWLNYWPYSYDAEDRMVMNGSSRNCKETYRNVRQVRSLQELISQPSSELRDGIVYYVSDLSKDYAIIDGRLYELYAEADGNTLRHYFRVRVQNGSVRIGGCLFTSYLVVSNPDTEQPIYIPGHEDGYIIRVYYMPGQQQPFTIYGYPEGSTPGGPDTVMVDSMYVFMGGSYQGDPADYTHYFKLPSASSSYLIAYDGWYQLSRYDRDYKRLSSIVDDYRGNNPHSGGNDYDNGYEYLSRYSQLFKYALGNQLFNESCFIDPSEAYERISQVGFSGLTDSMAEEYWSMLHEDTKVHAFCDIVPSGTTTPGDRIEYDPDSVASISSKTDYAFAGEIDGADGVTNQIVNTKVVDISFFLPSDDMYSREYQEMLRYIQTKVMPYVEQVLPSTVIPRVRCYLRWIYDNEEEVWRDDYHWTEEGIWPNRT